MKPLTTTFRLLTPLALLGVAHAQSPIPVFSIGWNGPTISLPDSFTGTPITEGDLLRFVLSGEDIDETRVIDVPMRDENRAVPVVANLDAIVEVALDQNFVPVVDSRGVLMGIVTRRTILTVCYGRVGASS